jgi:ResB-like family protein
MTTQRILKSTVAAPPRSTNLHDGAGVPLTDNGPVASETLTESGRKNNRAKGSASAPPPPKPGRAVDSLLDRIVAFFSSLRLTVVCLAFGVVLVFAGTLAQVDLGLYRAQNEFFRSFFIYWAPKGLSWKIPVFPGGYFLGGVLLLNLVTAHITRFKWTRKKAGLWIIHSGLILLLLGQLLTDILARESALQLFVGETKNYSEDFRATELVLIDKSDPQSDLVYSIPQKLFGGQSEIRDARLPFVLRLKKYWANAAVVKADSKAPMAIPSGATAGDLKDALIIPEAPTNSTEERNSPAAVVEVLSGNQSLGSFLATSMTKTGEQFTAGGKSYEVALRFIRYYYPFSLTLLKATHEQYRGTLIPKNFASRVRVQNPQRNEARETDIYMNNPLRYSGLTFYQYQMAAGEMAEQAGVTPSSTFQVVRNPSWLTPYLSCVLIALGLLLQFGSHLVGFLRRRI